MPTTTDSIHASIPASIPDSIQVLKFGGSVLNSPADLPALVAEVHRRHRTTSCLVVVVSAFRGRTDHLLDLADRLGDHAVGRAALLGLGEQEAAAATAIALDRAGLPVRLVAPHEVGITTEGDPADATVVAVQPTVIHAALSRCEIAVVPGFVARGRDGEPHLLGRGGSDLTAILLAEALDGRAVLIKDAGAVYEHDPAGADPAPRRFDALDYDDALALGERVIQARAIHRAQSRQTPFEVTGLASRHGTLVHAGETRLAAIDDQTTAIARPARIAILGLGTVGGGVAALLAARPDRYELVGSLVRDPRRARPDLPADLLVTDDASTLLDAAPDIVVETLGGLDDADHLIRTAIRHGADIVSANKALFAERGSELDRLAARHGRDIRISASVGGGLPVLERIAHASRRGRVVRVEGVLNGTTSFILAELGGGRPFAEAFVEARRRGYAEADATADLDGIDAACKLSIIARTLGVAGVTPDTVERDSLDAAFAATVDGTTVRQVATLNLTGDTPRASVRLTTLDPHDHLAVQGAGNAIAITFDDGEVLRACARGAGRWPTAHSVVADIDDLIEHRRQRASHACDRHLVTSPRPSESLAQGTHA